MFDRIIVGIITFLVTLSIYSIQKVDRRNDTIETKVTELEATKASKSEVKQDIKAAIITHEEKEAEIFGPMQQDLKEIKEFLFYNKRPD